MIKCLQLRLMFLFINLCNKTILYLFMHVTFFFSKKLDKLNFRGIEYRAMCDIFKCCLKKYLKKHQKVQKSKTYPKILFNSLRCYVLQMIKKKIKRYFSFLLAIKIIVENYSFVLFRKCNRKFPRRYSIFSNHSPSTLSHRQ